ncbi:MAG: Nuclear envelope morphology protein 1 [Chaenotheca gracillima]|nr:MAG: Nuclear envelope morphology protein 1 [Chaenotheca gracillima]
MATKQAARQARSASNAIAVNKKYTVQSTGIWERVRSFFAVDPTRSTGVPLNPQFRNPPPGALAPETYDDPTTTPAADIAENPYWKRDMRRSYPKLSIVNQGDVVGLLSVGSKANPREDTPLIGDAGAKQLVQLQQEGQEKGLANFFEKDNKSIASVLGPNGLPPMPPGQHPLAQGTRYEINKSEGFSEE